MTADRATIIRDLGDGLVLRRGRPSDAAAIERHNSWHLRDDDATEPDRKVGAWTRDLASKPHPTFSPELFTVVEDTRRGEIVSCTCLIPQTWAYEGVPISVGRPELVSTDPAYRDRGLIRAQFEVLHQWSAERGDKLNAITGIPYFYRQFGYEMCVASGTGRLGHASAVPKLGEGQSEKYAFRPATEGDVALLAELCERGARRGVLSCLRDEATWKYELSGRDSESMHRREFRVVESLDGEPDGFLAHGRGIGGHGRNAVVLLDFELKEGVSWAAVAPAALRYLASYGREQAAVQSDRQFERIVYALGAEHPLYEVVGSALPERLWPYAWYMRVPDWTGFLQTIAPALERRLAQSTMVGHTGDLRIGNYRMGVRLAFEAGRIAGVEPWTPTQKEWGNAKFPGFAFLQALLGHRSIEELEYAFPDVGFRDDETRCLLRALFPKRPSNIWGLG